MQPVFSGERIRAEYERIAKMLKRRPTSLELGGLSRYSAATFRKRLHLFEWGAAFRREVERRIAERKSELAAQGRHSKRS